VNGALFCVSVIDNLNYCKSYTESHTFQFKCKVFSGFVTGRRTDGQAGIIHVIFISLMTITCRRLWPRSLRRKSAVSRLLGLRVRIPPVALMSVVGFVCLQVEVTVTNRSLVQRSPTVCGVSQCDLNALNSNLSPYSLLCFYQYLNFHLRTRQRIVSTDALILNLLVSE